MKRIVHIIDNLTLGGAETLLFSTIKKLSVYEHHIIILNSKIQITEIKNYAQIHCLDHSGWLTTYKTCKKLKNLVALIDPEVVHSHLFLSSFLSRLALGTKYNIVYSIHTLFSEAIFNKFHFRLMEKYVYKKEHKLIAVSNYALYDYKKTITRCDNGYVLYNFIDDVFFGQTKKEISLENTSLKRWVAVGSLKPVKNYETMISIFQKFYNSSDDKEGIVLDIFGEGPLKKILQKQINQASLPIRLMGMVNNIHLVLDKYDAYLSTSLYEGYGIAPMEAMARGLPLFLSNIPVYKEIYGDYSFFFNVGGKTDDLFLKMCKSYQDMTFNEKKDLMNKSRQHASNIANGKIYIRRLLEIYQLKNMSTSYTV